HGAVANGDGDLNTNAPIELDAVVVEEIDGAVRAFRDRTQRIARHRLGTIEQFGKDGGQMVAAVGFRERRKAARADAAGGDLRHQIALERMWNADVAPEDFQQRIVKPIAVSQLERG